MANWLQAILSGLGTAGGAMMGGPFGAAVAGGLGSAAGSYFGGRGGTNRMPMDRGGGVQQMNPSGFRTTQMSGGSTASQMPNFTPEQQNIISQLLSGGAQGMQNLPSAEFEPIEQMYKTQYEQQILPALKEQYTASGDQRSGSFASALGSAGAGLAERLAGARQQFNMQNRQSEIARLMGMLQTGMQPQFQYGITPPAPGWGTSLAGGAGQGLGMAAPLMMSKWLGI